MNVRLGMAATSAAILVLLGCSHVQAKKVHGSQVEEAQSKTAVTLHKHQGKADSIYIKKFQFFVDLNKLNHFPTYKNNEKREGGMTPEQLDLIWEKISQELPEGTDFSIKKASIEGSNISAVEVLLEQSVLEDDLSTGDFIVGYTKGERTKWGVQPRTAPKLQGYADVEKWDKETGFSATQIFLLEKYPVAHTTIFIKGVSKDGHVDNEASKAVLDRVGIHVPAANFIVLPNGSIAAEIMADLVILNALYNEQQIINIIPDLSY